MSLINDALKRARQAQQKTTPLTLAGSSMRPAEMARPRESDRSLLLPMGLLVLVVVAGAGIIWFVLSSGDTPKARSNVTTKAATPVTQFDSVGAQSFSPTKPPIASNLPLPEIKIRQSALQQHNVGPNVTLQSSNVLGRARSVPPGVSIPATNRIVSGAGGFYTAARASPSLPKLQGIFYRSQRPAALINGRMVLEGRMLGEYLVTAINPASVILVREGQTNILEMPN